MTTESTHVGTCLVCAGRVMREARLVYRGDRMHAIAGPGSRNQMTKEHTIACEECGVMYAKAPPAYGEGG